MQYKISVLGAGTWGIALARLLANNSHDVTVWSALPQEIEHLKSTYRHPNFPEVELPASLHFTTDLEEACKGKKIIVVAVPSIFVRSTIRNAKPWLGEGQILVDVAKGIEADSLLTMTQVIRDELGEGADNHVVAFSGPTHAEEVIRDVPTAIVSACVDLPTAQIVQDVFSNSCMRTYTNTDVLGVELSGAMKNIIALAAGVSDGLGFGDNTRAALITRGAAEITRLGVTMGCREQTFHGLAGVGDLIVTCTSQHSRNHKCGYLIGQGEEPAKAIKDVGMVVEGVNALPAAMQLKARYGVEMPIAEAMNMVVNEHADPKAAAWELMNRDKKSENDHGEATVRFEKDGMKEN